MIKNKNRLLFIGLFVCLLFACHEETAEQKNQIIKTHIDNDTLLYKLMKPIKESCTNIVFTDSMFRAWNIASIENIKFLMFKDSCEFSRLERHRDLYTKGDNERLEFCKTLNYDSIITKEDLKKGFYIVETVSMGARAIRYNYFIRTKTQDKLDVFAYESSIYPIWNLSYTKTISKKEFTNLYNKIRAQKIYDETYTYVFIITYFSENKADSFLYLGFGCNECIEQFYSIAGAEFPANPAGKTKKGVMSHIGVFL